MSSALPRAVLHIKYAESARDYLRSLPPEHFMEATAQATQRKITLESLDLVHARRPDVHVFNELLVQYPQKTEREIGKVVPDNMVVISEQAPRPEGSYDLPFEPARPFWVLEYVSKTNRRKDYEESFVKYERDLKVPYYLVYYPDNQDLTLYRHNGKKYVTVKPNEQERYEIPQLNIELKLVDGWVRFWYEGELLPLPADLQREVDELKEELESERRRANRESRRAAREAKRADDEAKRAEEAMRHAEAEQKARLAAEREIAELREQLQRQTRQ
jgi:Uma2 family endonuclease